MCVLCVWHLGRLRVESILLDILFLSYSSGEGGEDLILDLALFGKSGVNDLAFRC